MNIQLLQPILLFGSDEKLPAPYKLIAAVQGAHSGLRYLVLIALIAAIVYAYKAMKSGTAWDGKSKLLGRITMILMDLQFLLGAFLYVFFIYTHTGLKKKRIPFLFSEKGLQFFVVEHAVMMFIALILIHLGIRKAKGASSGELANKSQFRYFLAAFILIMIAIPWPFIYGFLGRGWF